MIGVPCNQAIVSRLFSGLNSDIPAISAVVERRFARNRGVPCCPLVVDEMFSKNERAIVRASEVRIAFRETEIAFLEKKTTG
jgi:butyrate kinase